MLTGTIIPKGSLVISTDGVILSSINNVTIGGEKEVTITFVAQQTGPIIIVANTLTTIITVIAVWDSINNP